MSAFFEPILSPKDPQRAALIKVYRLLVRLADEEQVQGNDDLNEHSGNEVTVEHYSSPTEQ